MDSIYETLMQLPIFNGASAEQLSEVIGSSKFHFLKFNEGDAVMSAGEQCTHVKFIISGSVTATVISPDGLIEVTHTLSAPAVIAPEFLFGLVTTCPCTVIAAEPTSILQISKLDFMSILRTDNIFLINFLNTLSISAQETTFSAFALNRCPLNKRIAARFLALTQRGSTNLSMRSCKRSLPYIFGVQPRSFDSTLKEMQQRGIISSYSATEISLPARTALIEMLSTP